MRRRPAAALVASLVLLVLATGVPGRLTGSRPPRPTEGRLTEATTAAALDALASLPLGFEPNVGQAEAGVDFVARGPGYRLALSPTEAIVTLSDAGGPLEMRLVGSNPAAAPTGVDPLPGRTNYLTGSDPSAWREDVPTFARVAYDDVWPGVDLVFLGDRRRLRHDFVVAPGADPAAIAVEFPTADPVTVETGTGDLLVGGARLSAPILYQDVDGRRLPVDGAFRLLGDTRVGYTVGAYDLRQPLVIDPTLVTSSYLGGAGIDSAAAVDIDGGGNVYIVGSTESSDLRTSNPLQNTLNQDGSGGKSDAFVAKLNPEGTSLLFATYLGGTNRDSAAGVAVGADGSVYVTGVTESENFPKSAAPSAQGNYSGGPSDAFVTKLNPSGSTVTWTTFIGGTQTDASRAIAVNDAGEVFVTGSTNSLEFPTANPFQTTAPREDDVDAFVTKLAADGATFAFSTRLGGSSDDRGLDIAVDPAGNAYVTGDTRSPGFPTARPLQAGAGGSASGVAGSFSDAFITKFGPSGNNLVYSTFLGGSDTDQGTGIAVDVEGAVYVTGTTNSPNFPVETALQGRKDTDTDAFVSKVNAAGSALTYSTYLGGGGADSGTGIVVDRLGGVTVVGTTGSSNFPTAKPLQGVKGGGATDAFISTLAPAGATLVSSTYLGGREDDQATGIAVGVGTATPVVVGSTSSADFPTSKPLQSSRAGAAADSFVTRISAAEAESPTASAGPAGSAAPAATAKSGTHDKRVRLLVATTAGLFLIAVLQTAYLRRKAAGEASQWGTENPEPLVPPPPVQTWGGGVRLIEEQPRADDLPARSSRADAYRADDFRADAYRADDFRADDFRAGEVTVVGGAEVAVPELIDEDWGSPVDLRPPLPPPPPGRPVPRVPLEELSFWDLFPEDLPPSRRPGGQEETEWALEDQEDVLVGATPPPAPPPPPTPVPWTDAPAAAVAPPTAAAEAETDPDDNLLLTELLDLSPAATQAANAAHYGNLIEAGGGDVGGRDHDDDDDHDHDHDEDDDDDDDESDEGDGDTVRKAAGAAKARSGSGSSGPGKRKPRPKRSGRRRPKPGGTQGGGGSGGGSGGGGGGGGGSGGGGSGGGRGSDGGGGGAGNLGG